MKSVFLRFFTSIAIKNGIAFALQVMVLLTDALKGILNGDNLSDSKRREITAIYNAAVAVRDFLARLSELVGAPANYAASTKTLEDLVDKTQKLDRITDLI